VIFLTGLREGALVDHTKYGATTGADEINANEVMIAARIAASKSLIS
jgi:hypothetical protein